MPTQRPSIKSPSIQSPFFLTKPHVIAAKDKAPCGANAIRDICQVVRGKELGPRPGQVVLSLSSDWPLLSEDVRVQLRFEPSGTNLQIAHAASP